MFVRQLADKSVAVTIPSRMCERFLGSSANVAEWNCESWFVSDNSVWKWELELGTLSSYSSWLTNRTNVEEIQNRACNTSRYDATRCRFNAVNTFESFSEGSSMSTDLGARASIVWSITVAGRIERILDDTERSRGLEPTG